MKRRIFLKQLAYTSAVALIVPSCMQEQKRASASYKKIEISHDQERSVEQLCEIIIPTTDSPGAKEISAHLFVLMMVDDCYKNDKQLQFVRGLNELDAFSRKKFGNAFTSCSQIEKESFVQELDLNKHSTPDMSFFYDTTKKLTIRAFTTSQHYLTRVQVYELVPSRYHGCVPVKPLIKKTA